MKIVVRVRSLGTIDDELFMSAGLTRGATVVAPAHEGLAQALYHAVGGERAAAGSDRWTTDPSFSPASPPVLGGQPAVQHVVCHGNVTETDDAFLRKMRLKTRGVAARSDGPGLFSDAQGMWTSAQSGLMTMLAEAAFEGDDGNVFLVDVPDWTQLRDAGTADVRKALLRDLEPIVGFRGHMWDNAALLARKLLERIRTLVQMVADLVEDDESPLMPDLTVAVLTGHRVGELETYRTWHYGDTWSDPASFRTTAEWMAEHILDRSPELGRAMLVWNDPVASQLLAGTAGLAPMDRLVCSLDEIDRVDGAVTRLADGQTPLQLALQAGDAGQYLSVVVGEATLRYAWVDPRGSEFRRTAAAISAGLGRHAGDAVVRPEHSARHRELMRQEQELSESARTLQLKLDAAVGRLAEAQREHDDNVRNISDAEAMAAETWARRAARDDAMERANQQLEQEELKTKEVRDELQTVLDECRRLGVRPPQTPAPDAPGWRGRVQKAARLARTVVGGTGSGLSRLGIAGAGLVWQGAGLAAQGAGLAGQGAGALARATVHGAANSREIGAAAAAGTARVLRRAAEATVAGVRAAPGATLGAANAVGSAVVAAPGSVARGLARGVLGAVRGAGRALTAPRAAAQAAGGAVGSAGSAIAGAVATGTGAVAGAVRTGALGIASRALSAVARPSGWLRGMVGGSQALPAPPQPPAAASAPAAPAQPAAGPSAGPSAERMARRARKQAMRAVSGVGAGAGDRRQPKPDPGRARNQTRQAKGESIAAPEARAAKMAARAATAAPDILPAGSTLLHTTLSGSGRSAPSSETQLHRQQSVTQFRRRRVA